MPARVSRSTRPSPASRSLRTQHFLSILDLTPGELADVLAAAQQLKKDRVRGARGFGATALAGQHVALLFEKPSLRTRCTFEIAVRELGGDVIAPPQDVAMGEREPIADVARNLERWVSGVVIRTFAQERLVEFAAAAPRVHVVNALTDEEHPCQALADLLTLQEQLGTLKGQTVAFIGDGNNVATSLAQGALMLGMHVHLAAPDGYEFRPEIEDQLRSLARHDAALTTYRDPVKAVDGVAAVYTDAWTSMGQEAEAQHRRKVFAPYQVNEALMAAAGDAVFMHCLPAHRGEEATDAVMDGPSSIIFDQAENRLHAQKALLMLLMGGTQ
ncbi:MAG TPA: ornithine carbamoyltransferase [Luteitalea sp.]|nr:ornithine carbamoyltransferase [Luteitalea sp.]